MGAPGLPVRQGICGELTCFTAMLTRTELMEPSIRTFSFSFLLMVTGCSRSSLLLLKTQNHRGLCTIKEQNAQGDPTADPRITIWDHRVQRIGDSQAGVLQDGGSKRVLQQKEHRLWSQGENVLKSSLLCYFPWASYPVGISTSSFVKWLWFLFHCWGLREIKKGQVSNSVPGTL